MTNSLPALGFKKDDKKVSGKHSGILFILTLILALGSPYQLRAAEVTSLNDEGDGSLRQLVADAVAGETITFSQAGTITLTSPITIDKHIVIDGGNSVTISGGELTSIFKINLPTRHVVYDGYVYRTLLGANVHGTTKYGNTEQTATPMPTGFAVAPDSDDIVQNVIAPYYWDIWRLCTENKCWATKHYGANAGVVKDNRRNWEQVENGDYRVKAGNNYYRLLIRADVSQFPPSGVVIKNVTLKDGLAKGGDGGRPGRRLGHGAGGGGAGMGGAIAVAGGTVLINGVEFIDNKAKGGNGGNAKLPVGATESYSGAGGGSIFGGSGSRVNWGSNYKGRPGGFGGGGSGGLDYSENNSYGGTGGFGGGGGGGATGAYITGFWPHTIVSAGPAGQAGLFGGAGSEGQTMSYGQGSGDGGGGGGGAGLGGALFIKSGDVTVSNSTFTGSVAEGGSGGAGSAGGADGQGVGGAIFVYQTGNLDLSGSAFAQSQSSVSGITNNDIYVVPTTVSGQGIVPGNDTFTSTGSTDEDVTLNITGSSFSSIAPVANGSFIGIIVTTTPTIGSLSLSGKSVKVGDFIALSDLGSISFAPQSNWPTGQAASDVSTWTFESLYTKDADLGPSYIYSISSNSYNITASSLNDAPTLSGNNSTSVNEDSEVVLSASLFTSKYQDVDGDLFVSLNIVTLPVNGKLKLDGQVIGSIPITVSKTVLESGALIYVPDANYPNPNSSGVDSFVWTATNDNSETTTSRTLSITVNDTADPPVAANDSVSATGGVPIVIDILANDTDPLGPREPSTHPGSYTIEIVEAPAHGSVVIENQKLTYLADNIAGPATIKYRVNNGVNSNIATLTVDVSFNDYFGKALVDKLGDENDGSTELGDLTLREALSLVGENNIEGLAFADGIDTQTITLDPALGPLVIDKDIVIDGENVVTISGGGATNIFKITSGNVVIKNITLKDGLAKGGDGGRPGRRLGHGAGGGGAGMGGAIAVAGGTVLINGVEFIDNKAKGGNGGNAKLPVGATESYSGAGGGSIFGGSGSRVNWGSNYKGRPGGFGGGGSGGLDYSENNSYGGTGGFGGGGGGGATGAYITGFWPHTIVSAGPAGQAGLFGGAGSEGQTMSYGQGSGDGGGGGGGAGLGGALFIKSGDVTVSNSTFTGSVAEGGSGGAGSAGGADGQGVGGAIFVYQGALLNSYGGVTYDGNSAQTSDADYYIMEGAEYDTAPPVVAGTFTGEVTEGNEGDVSSVSGSISITDADADDNPSFEDVELSGNHGALALAAGSWIYTLDQTAAQAFQQGDLRVEKFTLTATNGTQQLITITINGANDAPVGVAATAVATKDGDALSGQLSSTDADMGNNERVYRLTQGVDGLELAEDGSYTFDPSHPSYQALTEGETRELIAEWVATDAQGASGASTLTITVSVINIAPVITVTSGTDTVEQGSTWTDAGATADGGETVIVSGTVNTSAAGTYTITYTATDGAGDVGTATRTVTVVDTTAPVITVTSGTDTVDQGATWTDTGATADTGETVTASGTVDTSVVGAYTITYTATDVAGNVGTATRTVTVADIAAPVITVASAAKRLADLVDGSLTDDGNGNYTLVSNIDLTEDLIIESNETLFINTNIQLNISANVHNKGIVFLTKTQEAGNFDNKTTVNNYGIFVNEGLVQSSNYYEYFYNKSGGKFYNLNPDQRDGVANQLYNFTGQSGSAIFDVKSAFKFGRYNYNYGAYTGDYTGGIPYEVAILDGNTVEQGGTWADPGATADGGETVTASGAVNTSIGGTYTITYTATDGAGNVGTATRTVTVVDTTAPVITVTSGTDTVDQGATWTDTGATADTGETVTASGTVDTSVVGAYTITYTATDVAGNVGTATRTVTVADIAAPVITVAVAAKRLANLVGGSLTDDGSGNYTLVSNIDLTEDLIIESNEKLFINTNIKFNIYANVHNKGIVFLTGNTDNQTTVNNYGIFVNEGLVQSSNQYEYFYNKSGGKFYNLNPDQKDGVTNQLYNFSAQSGSAIFDVKSAFKFGRYNYNYGSYTGDYTGGIPYEVAILDGNTVEQGGTWADPGATADGGETVIVSGTVNTSAAGTYTVTYTATDGAGNVGTATRTVTVEDTTPPVISVTAGNDTVERGGSWTNAGATTTEGSISFTGTVNTDVVGTYTITYSATDSSNNTATATRTVTVEDTTPPVISVTAGNDTVERGGSWTDAGATTTEGSISLTGTVNTDAVGTYTITYSATDSSNNTTTATRTVTVVSSDGGDNFGDVVIYPNNSARLTGQVKIEGEFAESGDVLAIYVGNELRGKQEVIIAGGVAWVNVLVNSAGGNETISFKVYDASTGVTHEKSKTSAVITTGEDVGSFASPLMIEMKDFETQTLSLKEGWNLVSFYVEADDMSPATVLGPIQDKLLQVKNLTQTYDPTLSANFAFLNNLSSLSGKDGYWLKVSEDVSLDVEGPVPSGASITVKSGWNLVGYPRLIGENVVNELTSLGNTVVEIKNLVSSHNPSVPSFLNTLSTMVPGSGYWLNVTQNGTWKLGDGGPNFGLFKTRSNHFPEQKVGPVWGEPVISPNLGATVLAKVSIQGKPVAMGSVVGVFVGNELRGLQDVVLNEGMSYVTLNVNLNEAEEVSYRVWNSDDNNEYLVSGTMQLELGEMYGNPELVELNAVEVVNKPLQVFNVTTEPFGFSFNTMAGRNYTVEATGDLRTWEAVELFQGSGGEIRFTAKPTFSGEARFFRVYVK